MSYTKSQPDGVCRYDERVNPCNEEIETMSQHDNQPTTYRVTGGYDKSWQQLLVYTNLEQATKEAKRLATKLPGGAFTIHATCRSYQIEVAPVKETLYY